VLQFSDGNRIAALSILRCVPIVLVSRLICDTEPLGAMVMCKAIGPDWHIAHAVVNNFPGMSDDREEKFGEMEEPYGRLSTESAERLLANWQACQARRQLPQ
jgi:hypothetical protein